MALNKKRSPTKAAKKPSKAPKKASKVAASRMSANEAPSERAVQIPSISGYLELPFKLVGTIGGQTASSVVADGKHSETQKDRESTFKQLRRRAP